MTKRKVPTNCMLGKSASVGIVTAPRKSSKAAVAISTPPPRNIRIASAETPVGLLIPRSDGMDVACGITGSEGGVKSGCGSGIGTSRGSLGVG